MRSTVSRLDCSSVMPRCYPESLRSSTPLGQKSEAALGAADNSPIAANSGTDRPGVIVHQRHVVVRAPFSLTGHYTPVRSRVTRSSGGTRDTRRGVREGAGP